MTRYADSSIQIRLPKEVKEQFDALTAEKSVNKTALIRGFIIDYINANKSQVIYERTDSKVKKKKDK